MLALEQLHVESFGTGPPLVLLHGWALHGGLFTPVVPALAKRYAVHVVDLPGHGYSAPVMPYTLDAVVEALATRFTNAPLTVLGWSFGGTIALRWAHRHPTQIARLVLACTTPRFVAHGDWHDAMNSTTLQRFGDELAVAYRLTLQRFLTLQVQGSDEGRATLATLRRALFARGDPSPQTLAAALRILTTTDLRGDVREIAVPTLVITGERDALTPSRAGAWLAHAMPAARHVEIAGAAHAPFLSHRAAFALAVDEFLDAR